MLHSSLLQKTLRKFVAKFVAYFQRILRIGFVKMQDSLRNVGFQATFRFVTFFATGPRKWNNGPNMPFGPLFHFLCNILRPHLVQTEGIKLQFVHSSTFLRFESNWVKYPNSELDLFSFPTLWQKQKVSKVRLVFLSPFPLDDEERTSCCPFPDRDLLRTDIFRQPRGQQAIHQSAFFSF